MSTTHQGKPGGPRQAVAAGAKRGKASVTAQATASTGAQHLKAGKTQAVAARAKPEKTSKKKATKRKRAHKAREEPDVEVEDNISKSADTGVQTLISSIVRNGSVQTKLTYVRHAVSQAGKSRITSDAAVQAGGYRHAAVQTENLIRTVAIRRELR